MALKYEDIKGLFLDTLAKDAKAQELLTMIDAGTGTYATASAYAARVGDCLASVLKEYAPGTSIAEWDIEDLIPKSLGLDHSIVVNACQTVQDTMNADASLGIEFIEPQFDADRAYGMVTELRNNPEFVNIADTFYDQLANFSQNVVDDSIRSNASVMNRAGVESKVVRVAEFRACPWCRAVAGTYDYDDVSEKGNDVWRRHENCRCTIDYITERNGARYVERVNNQVNTQFVEPADQVVASTTPSRSASSTGHDAAYYDSMLPRLLERYNFTDANDQQIRSLIRGLPLVAEDSKGLLRALRRRTNVKG